MTDRMTVDAIDREIECLRIEKQRFQRLYLYQNSIHCRAYTLL